MQRAVKFFRVNIVEGRFVFLLAIILFIAARVALFLWAEIPERVTVYDSYLNSLVADFCVDPNISFIASSISLFFIALILSTLSNRFGLIRTRTALPFAVPLFLFSLHPVFIPMSGDYIAVIFILLAFFPLLESYQQSDSNLYSFRSSILIAIASLFQIYSLMLIPLWWNGERLMRGFRLRLFPISLFALLLVYSFIFSLYFIFDNIVGFSELFGPFKLISTTDISNYLTVELVPLLFLSLFFILNTLLSLRIYRRDKVLTLSFMQFLLQLTLFLFLMLLLYCSNHLFFLILLVAFISYIGAYLYSRTNVKAHIYMAHIMLLLSLILFLMNFQPLFAFR